MIDYRNDAKWKVYAHISPSNKIYIGITCRKPNERWKNGNGYKKNEHFYRAIQKYGWNNFQHEIIAENLTKDEACNFEKVLIKSLNSNDYHFGYNICSGGEGVTGLYGEKNPNYGRKLTDEQKKHLSEMNKGRKHTESFKQQQSIRAKMFWQNEEYRKKCGNTCLGRTGEAHPMYGKHGADNPNSKKVICLNTGEIFDSAKEAAAFKGISFSRLCGCCRGENSTAGKDENKKLLTWMYYKDYLNADKDFINNKIQISIKNSSIRNSPTPVVNVDMNELFSSAKMATEYYCLKSASDIGRACKTSKTAVGYHWQYYEEYLKENNVTDSEARDSLIFIQ